MIRRTMPTFSCDIARAVSRCVLQGCQRHGTQEKSGSYRLALPRLEVPVPT
jgi:hypothetical protein